MEPISRLRIATPHIPVPFGAVGRRNYLYEFLG